MRPLDRNGARHGDHGYVCGLHAVENLPSAIQNIRKDASAQELIERDPVGANTHEDIFTVKFSAPSMRPALPTS